jgi:hypothetical protein
MSDEPTPPNDSPKKITPPPPAKEDDWGEDWESAFQAEEDMFFADADAGEEDFFIDEAKEPAPDETAEKEPASVQGKKPAAVSQRRLPATDLAIGFITLLATLKIYLLQKGAGVIPLIKTIGAKIRALPISLKVLVYSAPFLLLIIAVAGSLLPQKPPALERTAAEAPQELAGVEEEMSSGEPLVQIYPDPTRKKWRFPGFIIPVRSEAGDKAISFLMIDITIISVLSGEEAAPPADKENFMRDTMYQFFINRTQDELHHFSLARGEMQRKLKGWILKQWPDAPIESIIFDRYFFS